MNSFRFIYARELKELFTVYGCFYDILTRDGKKIKFRNILEIFRNDYHKSIEEPLTLTSSKPDSLFVMMNPGSSEPRQFGFREPLIKIDDAPERLSSLEMAFAKPDVTQYQVMRIMYEKRWNHVRVVNLSDIREPKSLEFFKRVKQFESGNSDVHTIFSGLRREERSLVFSLKDKNSPVILGWGRDKSLLPLADKALKFLSGFKTGGIVSPDNQKLYSHPSPNIQSAKELWLKKILTQLKNNS
ncbi:MAG: hypothetical protein ABFR75_06235 [Acidobacteriota bacterium]